MDDAPGTDEPRTARPADTPLNRDPDLQPDAVLELVTGIELPESYPTLRPGMPDRLGALAAWWVTVSAAPAPARVTLAWSEPPPPGAAGGSLANLTRAAADVPADVPAAIAWGAEQADRAVDAGADLIILNLPAELPGTAEAPGAAELPAHALLAAHLLQLDPVEATGWPSEDGLTDLAWTTRIGELRDGRRRIRGIYGEPQRLLQVLDARWLAAGAGLLARATARRTPTLLDGSPAVACGLLVRRAESASRAWWQAADSGAAGEGGNALQERVLKELRLEPLLRLDLESGPRARVSGLGGRLGLAVLETALEVAGPAARD